MKIIDGKLYMKFGEIAECGITTENYLSKANSTGVKCWDFIKDPADARVTLVGYDAMNADQKRKVELRFGNPYDLMLRKPILELVVNDFKAFDHYNGYQYEKTGAGLVSTKVNLPQNRVKEYARAASWLGMIAKVMGDKKRVIKEQLKTDVPTFFTNCAELINIEKKRAKMDGYAGMDVLPADFPTSYPRLLDKVKKYREEGYAMLIDPLFGNNLAGKLGKVMTYDMAVTPEVLPQVTGETDLNVIVKPLENDPFYANKRGVFDPQVQQDQYAVIRYCAAQGNNFDAGQVAQAANFVFKQKGWKPLSRRQIGRIISENTDLLTAGSQGRKAHDNTNAMQVKRKVTQLPLLYCTLDGWTAELAYQERGPKGTEWKNLVIVVVLDAFTKYPLGYAIGDRENAELIRQAMRNAIMHAKELFGEAYRPAQIQSDNYALKTLTHFYAAMTHLHIPARVGNAKAKIIEPYFDYINRAYCQWMPNWTGFGIKSKKENQVNIEKLDKVKHTFPDKAGVTNQLHMMMGAERKKKVVKYTSAFKPELDHLEIMTVPQFLRVLGQPMGDRTNVRTGEGIKKVLNGQAYWYDSFDPQFRANSHIDWQLYYYEEDMSKVLAVSPDEQIQLVLEQKRIIAMDKHSQEAEDHRYLAQVNRFNEGLEDEITKMYGDDSERVQRVLADVTMEPDDMDQLAMKVMFTVKGQQKERLQDARKLGVKEKRAEIQAARKSAANWDELQAARAERINSTITFDDND